MTILTMVEMKWCMWRRYSAGYYLGIYLHVLPRGQLLTTFLYSVCHQVLSVCPQCFPVLIAWHFLGRQWRRTAVLPPAFRCASGYIQYRYLPNCLLPLLDLVMIAHQRTHCDGDILNVHNAHSCYSINCLAVDLRVLRNWMWLDHPVTYTGYCHSSHASKTYLLAWLIVILPDVSVFLKASTEHCREWQCAFYHRLYYAASDVPLIALFTTAAFIGWQIASTVCVVCLRALEFCQQRDLLYRRGILCFALK